MSDILNLNSGPESKLNEEELAEKLNNLHQRMTYYTVPIPGETEWVKNMYKSQSSWTAPQIENIGPASSITTHENKEMSHKRPMECENEGTIIREEIVDTTECKMSMKITHEKPEEVEGLHKIVEEEKKAAEQSNEMDVVETIKVSKKTKVEQVKETKIATHEHFNLNFPLGTINESGTPCLVKIYDDIDTFKINDMVEFVGILSHDPALAYMYDEHYDYSPEFEGYEIVSEQEKDTKETVKMDLHEACDEKMQIEDKKQEQKVAKSSEHHQHNHVDINVTKVHIKHNKKMVLSAFPPSLVPRLHCLKAFFLNHDNPLVAKDLRWENVEEKAKNEQQDSNNAYWNQQCEQFFRDLCGANKIDEQNLHANAQIEIMKLRREIINIFTELLLGDALAAEYLLMHLMSHVFMRRDVTILGKFALNLANIPKPIVACSGTFAQSFYKALTQLFTMGHLFELTCDSLNKSNLIPNKDYNKNKLVTGMLQLPEQFHLVIDETQLNTGKLDQKGLMNFNSISDIIKWQKVGYDFSYHQQEFNTNMKVLTLSESKSILPFDFQVKLQPNVDMFDAQTYDQYVEQLFASDNAQLLNNIRKYFSLLSRMEYKLSDIMQKLVEEDIVHIRTNSNDKSNSNSLKTKEKMGIEEFHLLLVVAR